MRVALFLHGQPRDLERGHAVLERFMKKHKNTTFDVYLHAWTEDRETEQKILDLYKPVSHTFEQQIDFDLSAYKDTIAYNNSDVNKFRYHGEGRGIIHSGKPHVWLVLSRWYSMNECQKLVIKYYDRVISTRYDFLNEIEFHLEGETLSNIYVAPDHGYRVIFNDNFIVFPYIAYKKVIGIYEELYELFNNSEVDFIMKSFNEKLYINSEEILLASLIHNNYLNCVLKTNTIPNFI